MNNEEILQELYQTNTYLYQVNENLSTLDNRLILLQEQINSGDIIKVEYIQETNQSITLVALIMTLLVLLNFVERCFK